MSATVCADWYTVAERADWVIYVRRDLIDWDALDNGCFRVEGLRYRVAESTPAYPGTVRCERVE